MVVEPDKLPEYASSSFSRLAWPVGILLFEITALTPFVEFKAGGMVLLANPLMLSACIVTLATFFLLLANSNRITNAFPDAAEASHEIQRQSFAFWLRQPWQNVKWTWLLTHLVLFGVFVWLTLNLHSKSTEQGPLWLLPIAWIVLAIGLTYSLVTAFISCSSVLQLLRRYALQAVVAGTIGVSLLLLISPVRNLWTTINGPMLIALEEMFNLYPGNANINTISYRWPVIGASQISLLVTPPCSELESLLVFILLGGTLWVAKWEDLSPWRFLLVLAAGSFVIYLLLIFRLYLLVVVGSLANDPYVSVGLAHSRVSTLILLIFSMVLLSVGSKLAVRPEPVEIDPDLLANEELADDEMESEEPTAALATNDA